MAPPKSDNWIRRFTVSDPRRHKKGFTIYKVTSIVFPKGSPEAITKVTVWKRYNDFKKLHKELKTKHQKLYLQDKFPVFAKAKFFGRFEDDVIEERQKCAISLLEFIGNHPPLFTSNVFVKFFESGYNVEDGHNDKPPVTQMPALTVPGGNTILEPRVVHPEPLSMKNNKTDAEGHGGNITMKVGLDAEEGPMLKLGGTWQFPQQADSISLSSHSSDEGTNFTDTDSTSALSGSGISSPLQSADLQFFDPLQQTPTKQPLQNSQHKNEKKVLHTQVSNSWLLSLSPGPENSQSGICVDGGTHQQKLSPTISQEKGISSEEATHSISQEKGRYSWQLPESKSISTMRHDVYRKPHLTETELSSGSLAARIQGFEACRTQVSICQEHVDYVVEAASCVEQAQLYEARGDYTVSFAFYKTGIACLLGGVQGDCDSKRKRVVHEKAAQYLLQAEKIYSQHLASKSAALSLWDPKSSMHLQRPLSELQSYKVLGVINTIMLVLNTLEDRCYIMKVLHKSPCPVSDAKCSIVPQDVPYLVKLYGYFESDSAVFLLLQHASGGKLWDHVGSYFQSLPPTPVHELTMGNAYLGKKFFQGEVHEVRINSAQLADRAAAPPDDNEDIPVFDDTDSVSSQDQSYLELIREYASTAKKKLFRFGEELCKNNVSSVGSQESCIQCSKPYDKMSGKYVLDIQELNRELKNNASISESQEDNHSSQLPDTVQTVPEEHVNNSVSTLVPDVLSQEPIFILSWKNLESLDTTNLVENSQKLLESVNKTLQNSETVAGRMNNEKVAVKEDSVGLTDRSRKNMDIISNTFHNGAYCNVPIIKEESIAFKGSGTNKSGDVMSVVRCKSEDASVTVTEPRKERTLSVGRKRSFAANARMPLEHHYSSDDVFEGHGRGLSGSLDQTQQFSRLQLMIDRPKSRLPEANVRMWAAELVVVLDALHQWGIICRDLRPDNILLGDKGHLLLTYTCHWADVDSAVSAEAVERLYAAPEVNGIFQLSPAADWWSFGALTFELLTGKSLLSCHPGGIHSHTILNIPEYISDEAKSFLKELLRHNPQERLGSGVNGVQELKAHPFFSGIDWEMVLSAGASI